MLRLKGHGHKLGLLKANQALICQLGDYPGKERPRPDIIQARSRLDLRLPAILLSSKYIPKRCGRSAGRRAGAIKVLMTVNSQRMLLIITFHPHGFPAQGREK
jgi:hypothetical protein